MSKSVDTKQLRWHSYELASTGVIATTAIDAVTKLTLQQMRMHALTTLSGSRHWWALARELSSETSRSAVQVNGVLGYARPPRGQAKLAHLAEYGSSKSGPLRPHLGPALDSVEDVYEKRLVAAATAPLAKGIGRMGRLAR
jgi:hypothetical protein